MVATKMEKWLPILLFEDIITSMIDYWVGIYFHLPNNVKDMKELRMGVQIILSCRGLPALQKGNPHFWACYENGKMWLSHNNGEVGREEKQKETKRDIAVQLDITACGGGGVERLAVIEVKMNLHENVIEIKIEPAWNTIHMVWTLRKKKYTRYTH